MTHNLRIGTSLVAMVLAVALAGCGAVPPSVSPQAESTPPTGEYVLGPGDKVSVFVYEAPALSVTDLPVRPDGRLSLPLVPDIVAAGRTPAELAAALTERLKQYVKDPNVSVMVRDFIGPFDRQVRVIGEATEPLAIPYRDHMTVLDVMILTRGLTKFAAGNRAVIVRGSGAGRQTLHVMLSDLLKDGDIERNVEMRPGDTLIIPQTWF